MRRERDVTKRERGDEERERGDEERERKRERGEQSGLLEGILTRANGSAQMTDRLWPRGQ